MLVGLNAVCTVRGGFGGGVSVCGGWGGRVEEWRMRGNCREWSCSAEFRPVPTELVPTELAVGRYSNAELKVMST